MASGKPPAGPCSGDSFRGASGRAWLPCSGSPWHSARRRPPPLPLRGAPGARPSPPGPGRSGIPLLARSLRPGGPTLPNREEPFRHQARRRSQRSIRRSRGPLRANRRPANPRHPPLPQRLLVGGRLRPRHTPRGRPLVIDSSLEPSGSRASSAPCARIPPDVGRRDRVRPRAHRRKGPPRYRHRAR